MQDPARLSHLQSDRLASHVEDCLLQVLGESGRHVNVQILTGSGSLVVLSMWTFEVQTIDWVGDRMVLGLFQAELLSGRLN